MKIVDVEELHNLEYDGPLYLVLDKTKQNESDPRACGCASLALLNSILFLKEKMNIQDGQTIYGEMRRIQKLTKEEKNAVLPENMLSFIEKHSVFNSCRLLVMNPNGMLADVFFKIFLRRLTEGSVALVMMEIPAKKNDRARNVLNHVSFVHSKDGEVYFDGLRVTLDFLLRAFYFSTPTTLMIFALNNRGQDEK